MDPQSRRERLEAFALRCRDGGLPLTPQRRAVLEALLELDNHPSADDVLAAVRARLPEVSRPTVYRTLDTLVRLGEITKVCHTGRTVRYDPHTEIHHHFVCIRCDAISDLHDHRLDGLPVPEVSEPGFEVLDLRVQVRGICSQCREMEESA